MQIFLKMRKRGTNDPFRIGSIWDTNPFVGQPQANLWFGKTDDLWDFGGEPAGWGGPWWEETVEAGVPSAPYLMTGFDRKCLHISHEDKKERQFAVELDFQGTGHWNRYTRIRTSNGYACYSFPPGVAAHWVRIVPQETGTVTAQFFYS